MKKRYKSKTIIGGIVSLITMVSLIADIDLDQGMVYETVETVLSAIGVVLVFIGRIKAKGEIVG